ncbi:hypothetical protein ABWK90_004754 [Vibrio vulnificus]
MRPSHQSPTYLVTFNFESVEKYEPSCSGKIASHFSRVRRRQAKRDRKGIEMTGNNTPLFDDGSSTKELKENFKSSMYSSLDDYMNDLYWIGKNENFFGEPAFVTESKQPRRTAEEREEILIKKIHAQRRMEQHN